MNLQVLLLSVIAAQLSLIMGAAAWVTRAVLRMIPQVAALSQGQKDCPHHFKGEI